MEEDSKLLSNCLAMRCHCLLEQGALNVMRQAFKSNVALQSTPKAPWPCVICSSHAFDEQRHSERHRCFGWITTPHRVADVSCDGTPMRAVPVRLRQALHHDASAGCPKFAMQWAPDRISLGQTANPARSGQIVEFGSLRVGPLM